MLACNIPPAHVVRSAGEAAASQNGAWPHRLVPTASPCRWWVLPTLIITSESKVTPSNEKGLIGPLAVARALPLLLATLHGRAQPVPKAFVILFINTARNKLVGPAGGDRLQRCVARRAHRRIEVGLGARDFCRITLSIVIRQILLAKRGLEGRSSPARNAGCAGGARSDDLAHLVGGDDALALTPQERDATSVTDNSAPRAASRRGALTRLCSCGVGTRRQGTIATTATPDSLRATAWPRGDGSQTTGRKDLRALTKSRDAHAPHTEGVPSRGNAPLEAPDQRNICHNRGSPLRRRLGWLGRKRKRSCASGAAPFGSTGLKEFKKIVAARVKLPRGVRKLLQRHSLEARKLLHRPSAEARKRPQRQSCSNGDVARVAGVSSSGCPDGARGRLEHGAHIPRRTVRTLGAKGGGVVLSFDETATQHCRRECRHTIHPPPKCRQTRRPIMPPHTSVEYAAPPPMSTTA